MNTATRVGESFRRPSAFLPIVMSFVAVTAVAVRLATYGPAPQADEGAAAHLWQLMMIAQVPIVVFFAVRWVRPAPRATWPVLATQAVAALAALAPVYLLKW